MKDVPKRGDVYLVSFDPAIGAEIRKTRPAVIIQNDIGNERGNVTIVAAISSFDEKDEPYGHEVVIQPPEGGLRDQSAVVMNQLRSVDKVRLVKKLGALRSETMSRVDYAIKISLGLIEF